MIKYQCGHLVYSVCFEELITSGPFGHNFIKDVTCPLDLCIVIPGDTRLEDDAMS